MSHQNRKFFEYLISNKSSISDDAHLGIKAVLNGDFSNLPEIPSDNDWQSLALMIDGYDLSERLGLGEFDKYITRYCIPEYINNGKLPDKSIELWIFLCGMQRREYWLGRPLEGKDKDAVFDIYKSFRDKLSKPGGMNKLIRSLNVSEYNSYLKNLNWRYWEYQEENFQTWENYFDKPNNDFDRVPVFQRTKAHFNIIMNPDYSEYERERITKLIDNIEKHRWFPSMNSSQALTMNILGNLYISNKIDDLLDLQCDEGESFLEIGKISKDQIEFEKKINYLGERRKSSIDVFISGHHQIAIECKYTERKFGSCSSPTYKKVHPNYCDGNFYEREEQKERCPKSKAKALYWDYIPLFFDWEKDGEISHCPLDQNYQLVRTILSAAMRQEDSSSYPNGHAVLIYDNRNPESLPGGKMYKAYTETKQALFDPRMLRKISWQRIVNRMRGEKSLSWLTTQLYEKYGL